ncbi:neuraminidase, partial [Influenza A virus (A/mallard/Korea/1203/2010(H10N8))]
IITIGSISLGLVVFNVLLHVVSIILTVLLLGGGGNNGICNETIVREYNETVRIEKVIQWHNTSVIEHVAILECRHFMNNTEAICDVKGFAPFSKDNGIRIGSRGHVFVIREPFVSCSPTECTTFFLTQGSLLNDKHSNGTLKDISPFRTLMSVKVGQSPNAHQAKFKAVAWSSTACHNGNNFMTAGVTGPQSDAVSPRDYRGVPTEV